MAKHITTKHLEKAGFLPVCRSACSGQVVELYATSEGCHLAALTFSSTDHWRASGWALAVQQWRWLRLILGPSRRIERGATNAAHNHEKQSW